MMNMVKLPLYKIIQQYIKWFHMSEFLKKISIGVLSYQRTDLLINTIKCISTTKHTIDLMVLNNNEKGCVKNEVSKELPVNVKLRYFSDGVNHGVAKGRDLILRKCKTDFLILFDDDLHISDIDEIIESTLRVFENKKVYGIAYNIKEYATNKHNRFEIPHKNKKFDMTLEQDTYLMIGAGHAIRVKQAKECGGYPHDFGLYGFEEVDLALRLVNSGGEIRYSPRCVVHHKKSPDGRFSNKYVNYQGFINRTIMAKRYLLRRHYYVCLTTRSVFFLVKTKDFRLYLKALKVIHEDNVLNKFSKSFYDYIRKVKGFIWY